MFRLRVFRIKDKDALLLSNRGLFMKMSGGDLARQYLDEFMANPENSVSDISEETEKVVLRSYYLTIEQDNKLAELAAQYGVTKGGLFRLAIAKGLGTK